MEYVSSFGGPRVLLPTADVSRWIGALGSTPTPDRGLYGLACSVDRYCGVIAPWDTPLLVFGDDPADIYWLPHDFDGLFVRWIGADSLEQLIEFAVGESRGDLWDETTDYCVVDGDMTLMDTCTFDGDTAPRVRLNLRVGTYTVLSRYAESPGNIAILHRLDYQG